MPQLPARSRRARGPTSRAWSTASFARSICAMSSVAYASWKRPMMRSAIARKAALDRLAAGVLQLRWAEIDKRDSLRLRTRTGVLIREALAEAGIDPAEVEPLRSCDRAAAALADLGDTPELERADAEFNKAHPRPYAKSPAEELAARRVRALAAEYPQVDPPNFIWSSVGEWFAWACLRESATAVEPEFAAHLG